MPSRRSKRARETTPAEQGTKKAKTTNYYNLIEGQGKLLKKIHVLDTYKDAIEPTKSVESDNYNILKVTLKKLYPELDETHYEDRLWHENLNNIFSKEIPFTGIELDLVFVRNSIDEAKLEKTFYFNESGRGAKAVHDKKKVKKLKVIDTAAQHVDEGPGKGNLPFPSKEFVLSEGSDGGAGELYFENDFMKNFGFPTVNSWSAKTSPPPLLKLFVKYKYEVDFTYPKDKVNKQKELKIGNPDKNKLINNFGLKIKSTKSKHSEITESDLDPKVTHHILCKELGDAMQTATYLVFYNYVKKNGNYNKIPVKDIANEVTMLTCDKTVHYRNVLLGLPSILTTNEHEYENGKKKFKHSTKRGKMFVPSGNEEEAEKIKHDVLKRQIITNNEELIKLLISLRDDKKLEMIVPPENKTRIENTNSKHLINLILEIKKINTEVDTLEYDDLFKSREQYLIPHFLFKSRKPRGFIFDSKMVSKIKTRLSVIFKNYLGDIFSNNKTKIKRHFDSLYKFENTFYEGEGEAASKGGGSIDYSKIEEEVFPIDPEEQIKSQYTIKEGYGLSVDELIIFYELEQIVKDTAKKQILSDYDRLIIFMLYKRIVYKYNLEVMEVNHEIEFFKGNGAKSNKLDGGLSQLINLIYSELDIRPRVILDDDKYFRGLSDWNTEENTEENTLQYFQFLVDQTTLNDKSFEPKASHLGPSQKISLSYSLKTPIRRVFTGRTMTMKQSTRSGIDPKKLASHLRIQGLSVKSRIKPYPSLASRRLLSVAAGRKKKTKKA
jgi:hypothetical protein